MSVCVTFVVFTDCESSTRPISTNPGSMEAGEYGLTRGMCFCRGPFRGGRGRRAAVDFVVCFGRGGFLCVFFFDFLRRERMALYELLNSVLVLPSRKFIGERAHCCAVQRDEYTLELSSRLHEHKALP